MVLNANVGVTKEPKKETVVSRERFPFSGKLSIELDVNLRSEEDLERAMKLLKGAIEKCLSR